MPKKPKPVVPPPLFHAFTAKLNGRANRIITEIRLTHAFDLNQYPDGRIPFEPIKKVALWDTGATNSVITADVAKELKLVASGRVNEQSAGGIKERETYMVNFFLPNMVIIPGVPVSGNTDLKGDIFQVIIGMDIISQGDFSVTNVNGLTCVSYRYPSISTIDYVWHAERLRFAGTDKYNSCPCGKVDEKGKPIKFHLCHGIPL